MNETILDIVDLTQYIVAERALYDIPENTARDLGLERGAFESTYDVSLPYVQVKMCDMVEIGEASRLRIFLNRQLATYDDTYREFDIFKAMNEGVSPADFCRHVYFHEQGHHLLFRHDRSTEDLLLSNDARKSVAEGFCFAFSRAVTGCSEYVIGKLPYYEARGLCGSLIMKSYTDFNTAFRELGVKKAVNNITSLFAQTLSE